jgi:hypothetical protein
MSIRTDGSAAADARKRVTIDRSDDLDRMRYVCPNGHTRWTPTNNHIYCCSCQRAREHGAEVEPEHWELVDKKTDETVPWSAVILEGE